jgi:hypothetical protein
MTAAVNSVAEPQAKPGAAPCGANALQALWIAVLLLIGAALQRSDGNVDGWALVLLTVALGLAGLALAGRGPLWLSPYISTRGLEMAAAAGVLWQLWSMLQKAIGSDLPRWTFEDWRVYAAGALLAAAIVGLAMVGCPLRIWISALVAVHFALGLYTLHLIPEPPIDVFYAQRAAAEAIVAGRNPYYATWPDLYPGREMLSVPGTIANGRVVSGVGYPPVSLLCVLPGYLLGDLRIAGLAAISLAAFFIGCSGKSRLSGLMAALFLFTPRTFFILEKAWTEPFLVLFLAAAVYCFTRGWRTGGAVCLGLFLASKQHLFPLLPLVALLLPAPLRWKECAKLLAIAALAGGFVTLPFLLWDPHAFVRALMVVPLYHQFRTDSLSYMAWLFHAGVGVKLGRIAYVFGLAAIAACLWKAPRGPAAFTASAGVTFLVFFLFSDQAFCNYYYMVLGMFAAAAALSACPSDATVAQ